MQYSVCTTFLGWTHGATMLHVMLIVSCVLTLKEFEIQEATAWKAMIAERLEVEPLWGRTVYNAYIYCDQCHPPPTPLRNDQ